MNKLEINDIIKEITLSRIENDNFKIENGNNGPYNNSDTSVRNTAHWIGILKYVYTKTGQKKYLRIIKKLADNLCDNCTCYGNIKCFYDNELIETNGVIGQAWVIEGLINAYNAIGDKKYYDCAVKMFLSQKYDEKKHLWKVVNCSGKILDYDYVFNHQLWFAASGFLIINAKDNKKIRYELSDFIKNIDSLYCCYDDGLLCHVAVVGFDFFSKIKRFIKVNLKKIRIMINEKEELEIEKGYHLFDVYGFAIIKEYSKDLLDCNTKKIKKIIKYALDIDKHDYELRNYNGDNINNKYGYPYNSPAFEFPYVDYIFNEGINNNKYYEMLEYQIKKFYSKSEKTFSNATNDPNTLTARIYELCRYLELSDEYE